MKPATQSLYALPEIEALMRDVDRQRAYTRVGLHEQRTATGLTRRVRGQQRELLAEQRFDLGQCVQEFGRRLQSGTPQSGDLAGMLTEV